MNPFDDPDATFAVLVNDRGEHSLWPAFAPVPDGWEQRCAPVSQGEAAAYVERSWSV